jgi:hypothetical protein
MDIKAIADNVLLVFGARMMQLVGIPAGLAVAGWFAHTVESVNVGIHELKVEMHQQYTKAEAAKDFSVLNTRVDGIDTRVTVLEVTKGTR